MKVKEEFKKLAEDDRLRLNLKKRKSLEDLVSVLPFTLMNACTKDTVRKGALANGMIDDNYARYPDLDKILGTCRTDPSIEQYDLCIEKFEQIYNQYQQHGYADDTFYKDLGFGCDTDLNGKEKRRNDDERRYYVNRARSLSHSVIYLDELKRIECANETVIQSKRKDLENLVNEG